MPCSRPHHDATSCEIALEVADADLSAVEHARSQGCVDAAALEHVAEVFGVPAPPDATSGRLVVARTASSNLCE